MKKITIYLSISILILVSCNQDDGMILSPNENKASIDNKNEKVDICHYDDETGEYKTLNVSKNALKAHLGHGDTIGNCDDNLICHWEDPANNIWTSLLVKDEDLQEHLDHGDILGECGPNPGGNYTYIPDANFEMALIDLGFDTDGRVNKRVLTSDISGLNVLNLTARSINNLTGIQDFVSLKTLNFSHNQLINVDLSGNTLLTLLRFNGNQIVDIDLSNNVELRQLFCYDNQLITLDLSKNVNLNWVYSYNNNLESLNVQNNNNFKISRFYSFSNPNLTFITVDDPANANLGLAPYTTDKWRKASNSTYN